MTFRLNDTPLSASQLVGGTDSSARYISASVVGLREGPLDSKNFMSFLIPFKTKVDREVEVGFGTRVPPDLGFSNIAQISFDLDLLGGGGSPP